MKKQILSLVLALAMVLSMSVCAFATSTNEINQRGGLADVPLNGIVLDNSLVSVISVVVPTSIDFQIGTEALGASESAVAAMGTNTTLGNAGSGRKFVRLVSGTGTVHNNSTGNNPLKLEVVEVQDDGHYQLLEKVKLALAPADTSSTAIAMQNYRLQAGSMNMILAQSMTDGSTLDLKVFGEAGEGTYNSTSYPVNLDDCSALSVLVTMKVSLVNPTLN